MVYSGEHLSHHSSMHCKSIAKNQSFFKLQIILTFHVVEHQSVTSQTYFTDISFNFA